jgi:hypothetical protein
MMVPEAIADSMYRQARRAPVPTLDHGVYAQRGVDTCIFSVADASIDLDRLKANINNCFLCLK